MTLWIPLWHEYAVNLKGNDMMQVEGQSESHFRILQAQKTSPLEQEGVTDNTPRPSLVKGLVIRVLDGVFQVKNQGR